MSDLVNAFGRIALDETITDSRVTLEHILTQLRITNAILAEAYHVELDMIETNSDREL